MSEEENLNPSVGVQEEQENNQTQEQKKQILIPIFIRQLGEFIETVQVKLPDVLVQKLEISYNERIYIVNKEISLKELVNKLENVTTRNDYKKFIDEIAPDILLVDRFMNESDP